MNRLTVKNNKSDAYVRTIVLAILLLNQTLVLFGQNPLPFSDEQIYEYVSLAALVVITLWNTYKNNNYTDEAVQAQRELEKLKGMKKRV